MHIEFVQNSWCDLLLSIPAHAQHTNKYCLIQTKDVKKEQNNFQSCLVQMGVIRAVGQRGADLFWKLNTRTRTSLVSRRACEGTYTLRITVYKPIHHNICQCSCRVNRIINKYPPVNDYRAVINPRGSPTPRSLYLCLSHTHTHTHSHQFLIHHTALSESSQLGDKA